MHTSPQVGLAHGQEADEKKKSDKKDDKDGFFCQLPLSLSPYVWSNHVGNLHSIPDWMLEKNPYLVVIRNRTLSQTRLKRPD